ncbi:MAG: hypothetical protein EA425_17725 [Puniceicoccaceae bacterium]|nr:MAG: hypothetical protein EA425_17725 [Puniceicoccaceae bacterium]
MLPADQKAFLPRIEERLATIEEELASLTQDTRAVAPDVSIGRLSRLDSMQMQNMALEATRRLKEERSRLEEAIRRIHGGSFGRCFSCGREIASERLEARPDAVVCIGCASR